MIPHKPSVMSVDASVPPICEDDGVDLIPYSGKLFLRVLISAVFVDQGETAKF